MKLILLLFLIVPTLEASNSHLMANSQIQEIIVTCSMNPARAQIHALNPPCRHEGQIGQSDPFPLKDMQNAIASIHQLFLVNLKD